LPVLIARLPGRDDVQWPLHERSAPAYRCGGSRGIRASRVTAFPFHPPDSELRPPGGHLHHGFYSRLI